MPHLYLKGNPMSFTDRPAVHVRGTEDLLALIPFLLGFHPDTSMVLLAVDNGSGGIAMAARLDLPTAEQPLGPVRAALDLVVAKLTALGGISVVLAGYGPADRVEPMVTAVAEALQAAGIPIRDALRVAGDDAGDDGFVGQPDADHGVLHGCPLGSGCRCRPAVQCGLTRGWAAADRLACSVDQMR